MHPIVIQRGASKCFPFEAYPSKALLAHPTAYHHHGTSFGMKPLFVPEGEACKELEVLKTVWDHLFLEEMDRSSTLFALGGGSVCDLAGFAAATYMRGIDLILIPTTLLAMVDASIGGKTAVNFQKRKNSIGVTRLPQQVVIDPDLLETLPPAGFWNGMAEVIKAAVIGDPSLFELLEERSAELPHNKELLDQVIKGAIAVKLKIIENDLMDTKGERAKLNFGHTYGHALELKYGLSHGHAVAMGMCLAAQQSQIFGLCDEKFVKRLYKVIELCKLPTIYPNKPTFEELMKDKKRRGNSLHLILPRDLGAVEVKKIMAGQLCHE
ncbi:MAG: 3-dehydroquinate synthase [Verrucomicrobia bacterium]|nr:3-dehydroquinate synthase [Verrucomicrobiota bacterium]